MSDWSELIETRPRKVLSRSVVALLSCLVVGAVLLVSSNMSAKTRQRDYSIVEELAQQVTVEAFGSITLAESQSLIALEDAVVSRISAREGDVVMRGQSVIQLHSDVLNRKLAEKKLELSRAKSQLLQSRINAKKQMATIDREILILESDYRVVKMESDAKSTLFKKGIVSRLEFEASKINVEKAAALTSAAHENSALSNRIHEQESLLFESEVGYLEQELEILRQRSSALRVISPVNGIVKRLFIKLGASVAQGGPLAEIGKSGTYTAVLEVPQHNVSKIDLHDRVELWRIDNNAAYGGEVTRIEQVSSNGIVRVIASIQIPAANPVLKSDVPVRAKITTSAVETLSFVSLEDAPVSLEDLLVYRIHDSGKHEEIEITYGERLDGMQFIHGRVHAGDQLLFREVEASILDRIWSE